MKKNIIIGVILSLLFLAVAGLIYLNSVYLPVKVKKYLINELEKTLNCNVGIEKIKYDILRGFVIENIVVYDKTRDKENIILAVRQAYFNFLYIPIIKERKIIIPLLHIDSPYLNIRYVKEGAFNISKLFPSKSPAPDKQRPRFSFLIYKIRAFNAKVDFSDERQAPVFTKTIRDLDIGISLSLMAEARFLVQGKLQQDKDTVAKLTLDGGYNLLSKELDSKLSLVNLRITEFKEYLKQLPFIILSGNLQDSSIDLKLKGNLILLRGILNLRKLDLAKEALSLTADIDVEPEIKFYLDTKEWEHKTRLRLLNANISGIKYLDKINNISGDIALEKNRAWTEKLELQAIESTFLLRGSLENFLDPYLKINCASSALNLEKAFSLFPKPQGLKLSGTSKINIDAQGDLKKLPLDLKADLEVDNAKLEIQALKEPLDNIHGKIGFTPASADWQGLSFNYRGITYLSTGRLLNFKEPGVTFTLSSQDLNAATDFKVKEKRIRIHSFTAKYVNSGFNIKGNVDTANINNPLLDLSIKLDIDAQDLPGLLPMELADNIRRIKPEGNFNIAGSVSGAAKDPRDLNINAKADSNAFSAFGLKFNNLAFSLSQKERSLNISDFTAFGYSGKVSLEFSFDLKTDTPTYALKLESKGIDLEKLKSDTAIKEKDIKGLLNINADLQGALNDLGALKGSGSISIQNGKLWEMNLFKGLGELVLLSDYEKIMFKEGRGNFYIQDRFVSSEDLQLLSDELKLNCKGRIGFDGSLDFNVYTEANKNLIKESTDIRKFTAAILGELGSAISVKISGTIQKPKHTIIPVPRDLMKSIRDFFLGK